jgi:PAS domain S-box-containing protein
MKIVQGMRVLDRHFRTILDQAADGVLIEAGDRIAYVNEPYARMLGYRGRTDLSSATIRDIAHPEDFERLSWFGRCRANGQPAPARYSFRACGRGGIVQFDASVSMTRADGELLIATIVRELPESRAVSEFAIPGLERLSPRDLDVVRLLLRGKRSKEIAAMWSVSEKTIGTHRSRAFRKLALRSDLDLFRMAAEIGAL